MSWKKEYVAWYKIAEDVLAGFIPILNEDEIIKFVSQYNWLIVPAGNEVERQDSITRSDANIYFELSEEEKIRIGLVCNTLESVRRMRNLLHGFHTIEKENILNELRMLDDKFVTNVRRKIKELHFAQSPDYQTELEFTTNTIDNGLLSKMFDKIDEIMRESDNLIKVQEKSWRTLAPVITLAYTVINQDENEFRTVLEQLKPVYQTVLRIKTDKEISKEIVLREETKKKERQQRFREFIQSLTEKGVRGKEWRDSVEKWNKENPKKAS